MTRQKPQKFKTEITLAEISTAAQLLSPFFLFLIFSTCHCAVFAYILVVLVLVLVIGQS